MTRYWNDLAIPFREAENVLVRRVNQCAIAVKRVLDICPERRVMVQAGGNWGYWPREFARIFDTVYTFEPDHECFTCLCMNTCDQPNVVRFQAALGYMREFVGLWRDHDTTGNQHVEGRGIYPTLRIDDLHLETCSLIYLDVEGREYEAIRGAEQTVRHCKPIVIFEYRTKFEVQSQRTMRLLEGMGYRHTTAIEKDMVMEPGE